MFTRKSNILLLVIFLTLPTFGQNYQELCNTLKDRLNHHTNSFQKDSLKISKIVKKDGKTNIYFNTLLSYYPWREEYLSWFRDTLQSATKLKLGKIYTNGYELNELVLNQYGTDGKAPKYSQSIKDPNKDREKIIERLNEPIWDLGLYGRNIALWQSHGRYYDINENTWMWQRPALFTTCEDMFTQSYLLDYLIPMLENSGAMVYTPRERDTNFREIICDNDPAFKEIREDKLRKEGKFISNGKWTVIEPGFRDFAKEYSFQDNPFRGGTALVSSCNGKAKNPSARARWIPTIEEDGKYSVYISYKSLPNSSSAANYTVYHKGGKTEFTVDQRRGGGIWMYLGTFSFEKGEKGYIELDNRGKRGTVVVADAIKIGGGIGKLSRNGQCSELESAFTGALYSMHWSGVDESILQNWDTDYKNDYATRGLWTQMLRDSLNIPIDLSLAFHSDAGIARPDSTIGTLAIYTLKDDNGNRKLIDGRDRSISRLLSDYVQSQIVDDIRADYDSTWTRRGLWDRSYSESRTTGVPGMILELLSHQNFRDMKYGLNPGFRFTVARAVYKGILKTLSAFYGCDYMVQPLPIKDFSVKLNGTNAHLNWKPRIDSKEPTAFSEGYIVYTRIDDGEFDTGTYCDREFYNTEIQPGHIYSFKIEAYNKGGKSFPSEILSLGLPINSNTNKVLIVNAFDKVSGPSYFEDENFAGFIDSGVPYIRDISYVGEMYDFKRSSEFINNNSPGHGASYSDHAGEILGGNSFDYPYLHGKTLFELGYAFVSTSKDAFVTDTSTTYFALDIIAGKQAAPFSPEFEQAIDNYANKGTHIFLSGANIASAADSIFVANHFGYKLSTTNSSSKDYVILDDAKLNYYNKPNSVSYCVERSDGLCAINQKAHIWLRYPATHLGAGVQFINGDSKTISLAIPLETFKSEEDRKTLLKYIFDYFIEQNL